MQNYLDVVHHGKRSEFAAARGLKERSPRRFVSFLDDQSLVIITVHLLVLAAAAIS